MYKLLSNLRHLCGHRDGHQCLCHECYDICGGDAFGCRDEPKCKCC